MPKISPKRREERKQQILVAAQRCFSRNGFHQTTTADIVRESGVSQGMLYLYFKSKDDLIEALADDRHHGEAALTGIAVREPDPLKSILALLQLYATRLSDPAQTDALRVGMQGWAEALRNERVRTGVLDGTARARAVLLRLIRRGQKTGVFRKELEAAAMARVLVAIFQGFVIQATLEPDLDLEQCFRVVREIVDRSLAQSTEA
jgi:AcrR family transcriptional regulator